MEITREDIVQSALNIERWCKTHAKANGCDCPLEGKVLICMLANGHFPYKWELEEQLRRRGLKKEAEA